MVPQNLRVGKRRLFHVAMPAASTTCVRPHRCALHSRSGARQTPLPAPWRGARHRGAPPANTNARKDGWYSAKSRELRALGRVQARTGDLARAQLAMMNSRARGDDRAVGVAEKRVSRRMQRLAKAALALDRVSTERGDGDGRRGLVERALRLTAGADANRSGRRPQIVRQSPTQGLRAAARSLDREAAEAFRIVTKGSGARPPRSSSNLRSADGGGQAPGWAFVANSPAVVAMGTSFTSRHAPPISSASHRDNCRAAGSPAAGDLGIATTRSADEPPRWRWSTRPRPPARCSRRTSARAAPTHRSSPESRSIPAPAGADRARRPLDTERSHPEALLVAHLRFVLARWTRSGARISLAEPVRSQFHFHPPGSTTAFSWPVCEEETWTKASGRIPLQDARSPAGIADGRRKLIGQDAHRKPRGRERLSYGAIAATLNAERLPTRTGAPWRAGTVRRIVRRRPLNCDRLRALRSGTCYMTGP